MVHLSSWLLFVHGDSFGTSWMGKRKRARTSALQLAPIHSWIHAGHYSVGDPDNLVYLLCTPHGPFTVHQEYFCWVYARTGLLRLARRMVYGPRMRKPLSPKERARVADLIDMHNRMVIDLDKGPWQYYGFDIGDPTRYVDPIPKDYIECLTPQNTSQTISVHR